MTVLDEILAHKREEVAQAKRRVAPELLAERAEAAPPCRGFRSALAEGPGFRVIAELKRRSPSRGEIRPDFDPVACAKAYADAGAACLSVLTDARYFGGELAHLEAARAATPLPVLRKDFVVDPFQIDEARLAGADAVLLIAAALEDPLLGSLLARGRELGLDVLVEVHEEEEMARAASLDADLVGVNNRDLRSFRTDLAVTEALAPLAPAGCLLVAESGISSTEDLRRLARAGARAFLVGESLMREADPGAALRTLRGTT